ncbi:MAG: M3 family oligoendopeptidase [Anaerolineaceae bacterium]
MSGNIFTSPEDLIDWDWSRYEPYYNDMAGCSLTAASVDGWLEDWTIVNESLEEQYARLYVAIAVNTADSAARQRFDNFIDAVYPPAEAVSQTLKQKLLASGLQPDGFEIALRNLRAQADLFRSENLPLFAEETKLSNQYDQIIGAQTVLWDGQELTPAQLAPIYQEPERHVREKAWRAAFERQLADRGAINDLWQKSLALRLKIAYNAGKPDYRAYRWQELLRFDYTPADCRSFHNAIEQVVVPAALRVYDLRRQRLGVSSLRPWDLDVDPLNRPPLRPFKDEAELKTRIAAILHKVDAQLGAYFDILVNENLLDLENRKNKAPGGFCTDYPAIKRPFIFMNAVGLQGDVQTLLHESGHAFHAFESSKLRFAQQRAAPMEFAEVASMSMELLASPYLAADQGGFYSQADARRALVEHLEGMITFWPYMAVVDAFQHWVYENPGDASDPMQCDNTWSKLWERFMPGVDWSGLEEFKVTGWQRKLHILVNPFYYVEYGLASLGAVQVWRNALENQANAVAIYRQALGLGGTLTLPKLYQAAGARLAFDTEILYGAITLIEDFLDNQ